MPEVQVQPSDYNLTVFKIHVGKLTLKLYDKGERTLGAEVVAHNTKELGCKRSLEYFEAMVFKLNELMGTFINNITYAHAAIIDDATMENLSKPVQTGKTGWYNINQQRQCGPDGKCISLDAISPRLQLY